MIKSILVTLKGYLAHPELYPELGRKVYKNIFDRNSAFRGKAESVQWCLANAISQRDAVLQLANSNKSFIGEYKDLMSTAESAQNNCPVKMGGAGALDLIYALCEATKSTKVLETGVAYGWSSLAALKSLEKRKGMLYSSDMPYLDRNNDAYVGCVVPESLKEYWKLFRFADKESLPKIFKLENKFQVIHYDSDKSYHGRMWAYDLLWDKLETNGFFVSDDIEDNSAFKDWVITNKLNPIVVEFEGKYVGVVKK